MTCDIHSGRVLMDVSKANPCSCDADEIDEWKDASGLLAGGDPGGVTPAMLRQHQMMASDVILAAKAFLDARADDNDSFAALRDAVTDYYQKWPEG